MVQRWRHYLLKTAGTLCHVLDQVSQRNSMISSVQCPHFLPWSHVYAKINEDMTIAI